MTAAESAPQVRGYRRKPRWIYAIAFIYMLAPLGNLIWSLASLHIPNWYKPAVWVYWTHYVSPATWAIMSLIFLSGFALLFVARWSWWMALFSLAVIAIYNLFMLKSFSMMGPIAIAAMIAATLGAGVLLYFSQFRQPYLNPRLRWWQTSPRYRADIKVTIQGSPTEAILVDISRTGALLEWPQEIPHLEGRTALKLPPDTVVDSEVARRTPRGYGVRFANLSSEQSKSLKKWIAQLAKDPTKAIR